MTSKADFAPEEWKLLLAVPPAVGTAVMHAGQSGLGTVKESFAMVSGILRADQWAGNNSLITSLVEARTKYHETSEIETLHSPYVGKRPEEILEDALERCRAVVALLAAKKLPNDEAQGYVAWVIRVATDVAEASKEGGFLGIGGERVSEEERRAIAKIKEALGVDREPG